MPHHFHRFVPGLVAAAACVLLDGRSVAAEAPPPRAADSEFVSIFNGKTLEGWDGDPVYWAAKDGVLVGTVTPETRLKRNSFIIWRGGTVGDFELKCDYRVSARGNSGINYRSVELESLPYSMRGYQADIDGGDQWTANLYEERGRTFIAQRGQRSVVDPGERPRVVDIFATPEEMQKIVKKDDWNSYHLIVRGDHHLQYLNGVLMNEAWDRDDKNGPRTGLLGVQVHIGPPMTIEYRNIRLARFPNSDTKAAAAPGKVVLLTEDSKKLMTFETMKGLAFVQEQAASLTSPRPAAPRAGEEQLTVKSRLHLIRQDLGQPQAAAIAPDVGAPRDIVLIEGDRKVRLPDDRTRTSRLGFDQVYEWKLQWDKGAQAYRVLSVH